MEEIKNRRKWLYLNQLVVERTLHEINAAAQNPDSNRDKMLQAKSQLETAILLAEAQDMVGMVRGLISAIALMCTVIMNFNAMMSVDER